MLREEILSTPQLSDNTTFSNALQELEQCGFIRKFTPIGNKSKNAIYQLMDNYTLFYFDFIRKSIRKSLHAAYLTDKSGTWLFRSHQYSTLLDI